MGFWGSKKKEEPKHSGRIGDMSEEQEKTLQEFKKMLVEEDLTTDPRFDDRYLLRFL